MSEKNGLVLSNTERRGLLAYYYDDCLPEYLADTAEDLWFGIQVGDRMFDLNVWTDDITQDINCTVYECDWIRDNWQTNCRRWWAI